MILPVFANETYGEAAQLGLMLSTFGAGAVFGTALFGAFGRRLPRRGTFITSFVLVGIPIWIVALGPSLPIVLAALFASGVAAGPINPLIMTVSQKRIPLDMRGRVFGMITAMALVAAPIGIVAAGYIVDAIGVNATLAAIAACYLLVTVSQAFNPALREMNA